MELIEGRKYVYKNPVDKTEVVAEFLEIESGMYGAAAVLYAGDAKIKIPMSRVEYDLTEFVDNQEVDGGVDELNENPTELKFYYKTLMFGNTFVDTSRLHDGIYQSVNPELLDHEMTREKYERLIREYSASPDKHTSNFKLCVLADIEIKVV